MRIAVALLLFLLPMPPIDGVAKWRPPPVEVEDCGWFYFTRKEAIDLKSLHDLPAPIQKSLVAHLESRLGNGFYRRLRFTYGQRVKSATLSKRNENLQGRETPAFHLEFEFTMPSLGISSRTACIELRANGTILTEINLPNFMSDPQRVPLISKSQATDIARENGFELSQGGHPEFTYDRKRSALIWKFTRAVADDGEFITLEDLYLDAHSGNKIATFKSTAIR